VEPVEFPDPNIAAEVKRQASLADVAVLLTNGPVTSLAGVECLPNLQVLSLGGGSLSDLSPLVGLPKLTGVDLFGSFPALSDLSPLSSLAQLTELQINNSAVTDFSPLRALTNLTSLSLVGDKLVDVSVLGSLLHLKTLGLFNNQIVDPSPLAVLPELTELVLTDNQITDATSLASLKVIKLDLGANQISELGPLAASFCLVGPNLPKEPNCTLDVTNNPIDCQAQASNLTLLRSHPVDLLVNCPP